MSSNQEIRALLVAESANPEWRSVPLIGWSHSQAIANRIDAHLVTQLRNRDAILRAGLVEHRDFTAIDSEKVNRPLWKAMSLLRGGEGKGFTTVMALTPVAQYYFEYLVWKKFKKDLLSGKYNIVHRITPMSPAVPSLLAAWCSKAGIPFVCGPLNGGLAWPQEFETERRREKEWMTRFRDAHRWLPGYRSTRKHSTALLIASRATFNEMPEKYQDKCFYVSENALDLSRFTNVSERKSYEKPLQAIFVGRLVPYKGADMLIEAAAKCLRNGDVELTIVGEGPEMSRLRNMTQALEIEHAVRFVGNVPHVQLQEYYAKADMLLFPSIRELGGAVVIEAMSLGVVPVVVNYGGPPEFLKPGCGYVIELGTREKIVERLQQCLDSIVENPRQLLSRSRAAAEHVREVFTWEAKAAQDESIYRWALFGEQKPHLPTPDCSDLYEAHEPITPPKPHRKRIFEPTHTERVDHVPG